MDRKGEIKVSSPLDLPGKCLFLFSQVSFVPIEIDANFTNSNTFFCRQLMVYMS